MMVAMQQVLLADRSETGDAEPLEALDERVVDGFDRTFVRPGRGRGRGDHGSDGRHDA